MEGKGVLFFLWGISHEWNISWNIHYNRINQGLRERYGYMSIWVNGGNRLHECSGKTFWTFSRKKLDIVVSIWVEVVSDAKKSYCVWQSLWLIPGTYILVNMWCIGKISSVLTNKIVILYKASEFHSRMEIRPFFKNDPRMKIAFFTVCNRYRLECFYVASYSCGRLQQ